MLKRFLLGSSLISIVFFSQFGSASSAQEIIPPGSKTYTCPDIPAVFTIGEVLQNSMEWMVKSDHLPKGTKITLDQNTTVEYLDISAVTWFSANAVQCNYKIIDSKSHAEYGLNIFNWAIVKNCQKTGPKSMACLPA